VTRARPFTAILAVATACSARSPGTARARPPLQIVGEAVALRSDDAVPDTSPYFDGKTVELVGARAETLGIQVYRSAAGALSLSIDGASVQGYAVRRVTVARPSTELYGETRGSGAYPDELVATPAPDTDPAYFAIAIARDAAVGVHRGELVGGAVRVPVALTVVAVTLPPPVVQRVWAYYDPRELAGTVVVPSPAERACIAMFRDRGVLLSPDLPVDAWPARRELLAGASDIPAVIPDDPAAAGDAVRAWIAATRGTHQVPFAIPIDEPHGTRRDDVARLAAAVRAAGGGATSFRYAVTADPDAMLGDVDLFITLRARRGDAFERWTYNGAPPRAGSLVVDTLPPGLRTWGWIGARYAIPTWYVWDALYWHDRHGAKKRHESGPGRALDRSDAVTFDDGDDHGNLDGVLAYPGDAAQPCHSSLRLEALRRGLEDRALIDLAGACRHDDTVALVARTVPVALGDAPPNGPAAWPTDDAAFEQARRRLLDLAASCGTPASPASP
jgi:hypothetical protein